MTKGKLRGIVESYRRERIDPKTELIGFLPYLTTMEDLEVLHKWREFFRKKRVPYIVTRENNVMTLWKRDCTSA